MYYKVYYCINKTDHQSFILKPSTLDVVGVGVFAVHDIEVGTELELFGGDFEEEVREISDVPIELQGYCIDQGNGKGLCPKHFNMMPIRNYLNHSKRLRPI